MYPSLINRRSQMWQTISMRIYSEWLPLLWMRKNVPVLTVWDCPKSFTFLVFYDQLCELILRIKLNIDRRQLRCHCFCIFCSFSIIFSFVLLNLVNFYVSFLSYCTQIIVFYLCEIYFLMLLNTKIFIIDKI